MIHKNQQRGAVSLFVVVFAALLITVVTVSFVRVMIQDQQQASTTDLSQSAYDSAQAGVEDAKRALVRLQTICETGGDPAACATVISQVNSSTCNDAVSTLSDIGISNNEVRIQTGGSNNLDQAYTCVKVNLDTLDYIGVLSANQSKFIPLTSVDPFDTVQVEWFSSDDLSSDMNSIVDLQTGSSTSWPLLSQVSWKANRPPIMRTQMMQYGSNGFTLSDFESANAAGQSNANTLFMYPSGTTGVANPSAVSNPDTRSFSGRDTRKTPTGAPLPITCSGNLSAGGYACTAKLQLPVPISAGSRSAFLYLETLYNKANYRVTLQNGASAVKFNAVQPEVDSTGRTNDLFRRVQTRVEMADINYAYPNAAVDIAGNLCKDFRVTDTEADFHDSCPQ